jgi:hypothetical protein
MDLGLEEFNQSVVSVLVRMHSSDRFGCGHALKDEEDSQDENATIPPLSGDVRRFGSAYIRFNDARRG